jgi:hypothetical protein
MDQAFQLIITNINLVCGFEKYVLLYVNDDTWILDRKDQYGAMIALGECVGGADSIADCLADILQRLITGAE